MAALNGVTLVGDSHGGFSSVAFGDFGGVSGDGSQVANSVFDGSGDGLTIVAHAPPGTASWFTRMVDGTTMASHRDVVTCGPYAPISTVAACTAAADWASVVLPWVGT